MVNLKNFQDYKEYAKLTFSKLFIIQFSKDAESWFGDLYNIISSYNENSTKISVISHNLWLISLWDYCQKKENYIEKDLD